MSMTFKAGDATIHRIIMRSSPFAQPTEPRSVVGGFPNPGPIGARSPHRGLFSVNCWRTGKTGDSGRLPAETV